jgi:hypothetical protein
MKPTIFRLAALAMLLNLASCSNRQENLGRLDSMLLTLDSLQNEYNSIDTLAIRGAFSHFNEVIDSFNLYFDDNREDSSFQVIAEFSQLKGPFKYFNRHYGILAEQLDYTRNQLMNLREDAGSNKWEKEDLLNHIEAESLALTHIAEDLSTLKMNIESGLKQYQVELPRMRSVIQVMQAKSSYKPGR